MKVIIIKFDESVDITFLPKGTTVSVTDGTNTLNNGIVLTLIDILESEPILLPHSHSAEIGQPML